MFIHAIKLSRYLVSKRYCSTVTSEKMVRILNVAEKNDAAKSLADIMSKGKYQRREGLSKFNKIYEFDYNIFNQNATMTMTSLSGHLLNYAFAGSYKHWNSCAPVSLFDAPVYKHCHQDYIDIKRTLEKEIQGVNTLIIWTDCDREGENIGFEVINVCKEVNPRIQVYRAKFSEITQTAVQRAVGNLAQPDTNTSDAVDVRQELDLRIGAAFTRFQTLRFQKVFPDVLAEQLISYGSCQFPTLGFVVERFKAVQSFVPEPFWKLIVTHQHEDGVCTFSWKRTRLFDHLACQVLFDHCIEKPIARVLDVKSKPKSKWRPAALDTVELEKSASRKLHINAKETMKIAEKLYTQGFISYPRTETNQFPQDFDLRSLVENQTVDPNWGGFAANLLQTGLTPHNGKKSDKAHPPIHPIKYTNNLQGNEARVYEFIVRHFLACCSQDAQGHETTVDIAINDEIFSAAGLMIIAKNYLDVYVYEKWNAKVIPVYNKGEEFEPSTIEMDQSETTGPMLLTEADLIALMDKHGIGTDATHADHIETIKSRLYVGVRPDGRFVPGELGMGLVEGYDAMGYEMSKPNLRAELEADLKRICEGTRNKDVVLREQIGKYKEVFIEACSQANKIDAALSVYFGDAHEYTEPVKFGSTVPVMKCNKCSNDMVLKTKKDGKGYFISCMGFPTCRNVIWLPSFIKEATVQDSGCDQCAPHTVNKIKFKFAKNTSLPPHLQNEYIGCIGGCDKDFNEALSIRSSITGPVKTQKTPVTPANNSTNSNNTPPRRDFSTNNSTAFGYQRQPLANRQTDNSANRPGVLATRGGTNSRGRGLHTVSDRGSGVGVFNHSSMGGDSAAVVCNCGTDAVERTVRKTGPNCGRQFYACSKPQGTEQCGFFLWADEGAGDGGSQSQPQQRNYSPNNFSRPSYGAGNRNENQASGGGGDQACGCNQPAKFLTVNKDGDNKGRQFYACAKGRGQGCNYFQWADDAAGVGTSSGHFGQGDSSFGRGRGSRGGFKNRRGGGNLRGGSSSTADQAKRVRKCGFCKEEGHDKRSCPNR